MDVYREDALRSQRLKVLLRLLLATVVVCVSFVAFTGQAQALCFKSKITSVTLAPAQPVVGEPTYIEITVTNPNKDTTCATEVDELEFRLEASGPVIETAELVLEPNEVITLEFHYTFSKRMLYDTVTELWPAQGNRTTPIDTHKQFVDVVAPTLKLGFEQMSRGTCEHYFCTSPEKLIAGQAGTVQAVLFNEGSIASGPASVEFTPNTKGLQPAKQSQTFASLDGGYTGLGFPVTYSKPGTYVIKAQLLPTGSDFKTEGLPDTIEETITVGEASADLEFRELAGCFTTICFKEGPVVDSKDTATVEIFNKGKMPTGRFAVRLSPDGGAAQYIEDLKVGEGRTLTFPITFDKPGDVTEIAKIEPKNFKNTGQEKTEFTTPVFERSAEVKVGILLFPSIDPAGYEEWDVNYCIGTQCETKHLEPVNPPDLFSIAAEVPILLTEAEKLHIHLDIKSTDYFCFGHCFLEHVAYPGKASLTLSRAELLKAPVDISLPGTECREEGGHFAPTGPIVGGGKCFEAAVLVALESHIGNE
jgi:hypothetical protein